MQKNSTEEKIINAAIKEFSQHGYEGARIDRIAKRARINKAMIYYHFKGKEKLYERILTDTFRRIYAFIEGVIPQDGDPLEQIYTLIGNYTEYIFSIEQDVIRIILREISGGGVYFRRIALPNLILPVIKTVEGIFHKGKKENLIKDLNPYYTLFQMVGSVLFFNMLRIAFKGTELEGNLFHKDFVNEFKNNLLTILKSGIEKK